MLQKFVIFKEKVTLDPLLEDKMNQVSMGKRKYIQLENGVRVELVKYAHALKAGIQNILSYVQKHKIFR